MGLSKWAKQAQGLVEQHSDKINSGIDAAASKAKVSKPATSKYVDKTADLAKKAVRRS